MLAGYRGPEEAGHQVRVKASPNEGKPSMRRELGKTRTWRKKRVVAGAGVLAAAAALGVAAFAPAATAQPATSAQKAGYEIGRAHV